MRKGYIGILATIGIAVLTLISVVLYTDYKIARENDTSKLGATVLQTQLTDTIGTFRTNVNTSLTNLNDQLTSATSVDPGFKITSASVSGTISVAKGGTATGTYTYGVVIASGTNAFTTVAPSTDGNILKSSGGAWISAINTGGVNTVTSSPTVSGAILASSTTFTASTATSSFTIPPGVTSITINALGAQGATVGGAGGLGGSATGTLVVTPGQVYYVCAGTTSTGCGGSGSGAGGPRSGGGMSWISASPSFSTSSVILVAGGGGGGGNGAGGTGGGLTGGNGTSGSGGTTDPGLGGSQTAGGAGGAGGTTSGGAGGEGQGGSNSGDAGGGGGGFFGGGAGGAQNGFTGGSGGGGSSFMKSTLTTTSTASGLGTGNGTVKISYNVPPTISGNDFGGVVTLYTPISTTTINFAVPFPVPPGCTVMTSVTSTSIGSTTISTFNITFDKLLPATSTFMYVCI